MPDALQYDIRHNTHINTVNFTNVIITVNTAFQKKERLYLFVENKPVGVNY